MRPNPLQIGGDDSPQQVLAKAGVAYRWLHDVPAIEGDRTPEVRMCVSGHVPADSPAVQDVFVPAFRRLAAMSEGAIAVDAHWGASLHKEREGIEALRSGRTHLAPVYSAWSASLFPAAQALSLPFLFSSAEAATHVSERLYRRYFSRDFEGHGVLMGRMVATSEYNLFSRRPIDSLPALRGCRVACGEGLESRIFEALGAVPVGCSTPEAKQRLASGDVDAVSISDSAAQTVGIWRHASYRTAANLVRVNLEYGLSPSFYAGLSPARQDVLNRWLRGLAQAGAQLFYGLAGARARVEFQQAGMKFISLDADEQARWRDRVAPIGDQLARELAQAGYPARQMLEDLHREAEACAGCSADELMTQVLEHPLRDLLPGRAA